MIQTYEPITGMLVCREGGSYVKLEDHLAIIEQKNYDRQVLENIDLLTKRYHDERKHAEWLQRQIDEDVTIICTRNAEIAKKDKEIALWKQSYNAASQDNEDLREENAALIADIEELKRFVRDITLELQAHRKKTPTQMDMLFQKAYTLYTKHNVENRQAVNEATK